jgi:site-specific recombinase XerD
VRVLNQVELEGLIALTLSALSEGRLSSRTIASYKRYGFGEIRKHFKERDVKFYSESMADELVLQKRIAYENKNIPSREWFAIRKSAALLSSVCNTGELGATILPKWKAAYSPLRQKPSEERLGDKDDIFTLAYLTKQEMAKFNYSGKTTKRYDCQGFDPILRYCVQNGVTNYSKEKIEKFIHEVCSNPNESYRTRLNIRRTALMLNEFYETGKLEWRHLKPEQPRFLTDQFSALLNRFCLENEKVGIFSDSTLKSDRIATRQLLFRLEDMGHICCRTITLNDISNCISSVAKQNPSLSYLPNIRKFLRFLYKQNETNVDLSVAIPRIVPPRAVIQEGFTSDEINSLLNCVDRNTATGKRDYAIMMLATQTGLRAVDIASLRRGDINWRANTISIAQEKTKRVISLTLPTESGNAIVDYLLNGRPMSELPFMFLATCNPFRKLKRETVSAIVSKYMRRVGIADSGKMYRKGFHSFRRAFGGRLLESETPIEILSELLGHARINSSKPYLSANETGLKCCALNLISYKETGDAQ